MARLPGAWQARLRAAHSGHKATIRAMVWLTAFVLAAKAIAAVKEVVIAYRFGSSEVLEGYLLAYNLASWPVSLLFSVMSFVLVPELVRRQSQPDHGHAWQRRMTAWVWGGALMMGGGVALILPPLTHSGALGLGSTGREAALAMFPAMGFVTAVGILAAWHACQLISLQRHANTFLEAMPALGILVMVLWIPAAVVESLLWGTALGFALQLVLLMLVVKTAGLPLAPVARQSLPLDGQMWQRINVLLAAQVLLGFGGAVDQIILAHLPQGELAAFGYANRVMALVLTLSATVSGRALLPVLSGLDPQAGYAIARRWAWLLFWLGVLTAALITVGARPVIALLFERGAFTAEHTELTASILRWMALQIPLYLVNTVWIQWALTCPGYARTMLMAAIFGLALKWLVIAILIAFFEWTVHAIGLGLAVLTVGYFLVLIRFVQRQFVQTKP